MARTGLTARQRAFVDEYLQCWNASEAARRAGYSPHTADVIGLENLGKPAIAAEIKRVTADRAVKVDEALELLGKQARGSIEPFLKFDMATGTAKIDLVAAKAAGVLRLVKKVRQTRQGVEIELHDSQAALVKLLEASGAFKNQQTNINVDLSMLTDEQVERIARGEDALTVIATARPGRVGAATPTLTPTNGESE